MPTKHKSGAATTRYKQQHGMHHKHGKHYLKVYWPYLPIFAITFIGILTSVIILSVKPSFASIGTNISASSLLKQTNTQREDNGLSDLLLNQQLNSAAQAKATSMAKLNYWSPNSPSGETPWQFIQSSGYQFQTAGENLGYGFADSSSLINSWMNSPQHRANVLDSNYNNIGFGIAYSSNYQGKGPETIVVAIYASPIGSTLSTSTSTSKVQPFTNASIVQPKSQSVVRIESLSFRYATWSIFASGIIIGCIMTYLLVRHWIIFRKWILKGEKLAVEHPIVDIVLVIVVVGCAILNQTVGFIN